MRCEIDVHKKYTPESAASTIGQVDRRLSVRTPKLGMSTVSRSFIPDVTTASISTSCYDGGLSVAISDTALHSVPPRTTPKSGYCGQCGGWSARHPRKGWTRGRGRGRSGMNHLPPPRFPHLGCWIGSSRSGWPFERPGLMKLRRTLWTRLVRHEVLHVHSRASGAVYVHFSQFSIPQCFP